MGGCRVSVLQNEADVSGRRLHQQWRGRNCGMDEQRADTLWTKRRMLLLKKRPGGEEITCGREGKTLLISASSEGLLPQLEVNIRHTQ